MSIFDYVFNIIERHDPVDGSRNFPTVKADIKEEIVPCVNPVSI